MSELVLESERDGVPSDCVVTFDNIHTVERSDFRRFVTGLDAARRAEMCRVLRDSMGC